MTNLASMTLNELEELMKKWGQPRFRAKQIFEWIHRGTAPRDMNNLPKALRGALEEMPFGGAKVYQKNVSQKDGTIKYLFELEDGNLVEGVLMQNRYGSTFCLSTQVGCAMGCAFCASTVKGCVRNLTAGEMLSQVCLAQKDDPAFASEKRRITNIVLMGSGEPLNNYEEVKRFLYNITAPEGLNFSPRNISLSTCGLVPQIRRLARECPHVTLCISLHAANDEVRNRLMPINRRYPVADVINAAKEYADTTGRRVVFEYALIRGVNDSQSDAAALASLLRGIICHINLIPLNPVKERDFQGTPRDAAYRFAGWLNERKVSATVRREMGADIEGACGQLRSKALEELGGRTRNALDANNDSIE